MVVVARGEAHPPALERDRGGVVVAVAAQVDPGQVGRLERPHPGLGQVLGEQVDQQVALRGQAGAEGVEPVVALGVAGDRRHHAER